MNEFEKMKKALTEKYSEDQLEIRYIDTSKVKLSDFPEIQKIIRAGYSFPITVINGKPRLAGAISKKSVLEIIESLEGQGD